jgi:hypothetical protein
MRTLTVPAANVKIRIKAGANIYEETCTEAFPNPDKGPYGIKFKVISEVSYSPLIPVKIFLVGDDENEEIEIHLESTAMPSLQSARKRYTFSALIPNGRTAD